MSAFFYYPVITGKFYHTNLVEKNIFELVKKIFCLP